METDTLDDFSDLDTIIAESEARRHANSGIVQKIKKLAHGGLTEEERIRIQAEVDKYEELYIWQTTAAVALMDKQECLACGHAHRFFKGWYAKQKHRTDPNCSRLVRGKPLGVAEQIEEHNHGSVEMCGDCAEAQIIIGQYCKGV